MLKLNDNHDDMTAISQMPRFLILCSCNVDLLVCTDIFRTVYYSKIRPNVMRILRMNVAMTTTRTTGERFSSENVVEKFSEEDEAELLKQKNKNKKVEHYVKV